MALDMLEMDGIALLKRIEVEFKIPVVMMSANDKEVIASRCLESGATFYLTKPLTISNLSDLWQYVYLKKRNERMVLEEICSDLELRTLEKVSKGDIESESSVNESNWRRQESWKKSSKKKNQNEGGNKEDNVTKKMSMVVWTNGLHNKFLDAIDQIGLHSKKFLS
ncbi:two-component response regulator ARR2-like [Telopea speciosissima]|uniref:two-component response regulator ARR2-like n=1 Tax=Telopea speciosissima TaxID=54955 RepID=UPI001CC5AB0F|nr:two-component response regulator ARR2-like [Telopea speciosissima]